ncbi:MAG TPA: hypothetical protein VNN09_07895 [Candidatus Competibacteraceae bacterium]|nr:hypothetical protein [Candidatus Competibacteraceae bacterium]
MTRLCALLLLLISSLPAAAQQGWRYVVYEDGQLRYDGPLPPVDLTYPADGGPAPMVAAQAAMQGQVLSAREQAERRYRQHVIIVPPAVTMGGRERTTQEVPLQVPASGMSGRR